MSNLIKHIKLADCLQLSDKSHLLVQDQKSLRNNLAHGQSITTQDWSQIVRMSQRFLVGNPD